MSKALYNKYRPKSFSEVVNQNHVKITLQNEIERGKIAQAYLFSGPRGIGKTTIARIFAKTLNCLKRKKNEPCCQCENCLAVQEGKSFDLIEIDAASNRGINEIRELREHVKYPPSVFQYKIFIIDEAHMLTIEAFNALLKTLEEPPKHAIFILATTEIHKLPETIISRCQRFDFKKVKIDDITKLLETMAIAEKVKVEKGVLENIARHSEGYVRDAVGTLGQILSLNDKEITSEEAALVLPHSDFNLIMDLVGFMFKKDLKSSIDLINQLVNEGIEVENFTNDLLEYLRKLMLVKVMGSIESLSWELDKKFVQRVNEQAEIVSLSELLNIIDLILAKLPSYKNSKIIQLPLEILAAETVLLLDKKNYNLSQTIKTIPSEDLEKDNNQEKKPVSINTNTESLEEITKIFPEILTELRKDNHSLTAFIKNSRPVSLANGILTLGFQYKFQQEKIAELKNLKTIDDAFSKISNQKIKVETIVDENFKDRPEWNLSNNNKTNEVNQIAEDFGGEVMED